MELPLNILVEQILLHRSFDSGHMWITPWTSEDEFEELQPFVRVRAASKELKLMLSGTAVYAALLLANLDLENESATGLIRNGPRRFIVACFLLNLKIMGASRKLLGRMPSRIVDAHLEDLPDIELQILPNALWSSRFEVEVMRTRQETLAMQQWLTPKDCS
jgi:hypothetical protein